MEKVEFLRSFVVFTEFLSVVVGVFFLRKKSPIHWQLFPFYLIVIFTVEIIGWYFNTQKLYSYNIYLYRLLDPIQFIFLFWLYDKILVLKPKHFIVILFSIIYLISLIAENYFFAQGYKNWNTISFTIGNLLLLISVLIYYFKLINSNLILTFRYQKAFWVSLGILIYYLGSFPFYGLANYLYQKNQALHFIYFQIVLVLSSIMYLLFTASFIWGRKEK